MFVLADELVWCAREGVVCVFHLESGSYYRMEGVSATVWKALQRPQELDALCNCVADAFAVRPQECREDIRELLDQLRSEKLVEGE